MRDEGFAEVRAAALKTLIIWSRFNPDKGSRDSVRYLRKKYEIWIRRHAG
jgi:hypothetical protein